MLLHFCMSTVTLPTSPSPTVDKDVVRVTGDTELPV